MKYVNEKEKKRISQTPKQKGMGVFDEGTFPERGPEDQ